MLLSARLIRKSTKNAEAISQWSKQRLFVHVNGIFLILLLRILRFTTSVLLLTTIVCFTTRNFCYILQPFYLPFDVPKESCGVYQILAVAGGLGHSICFPIVLVLAILTTVDRYEVMNFIHSSDTRKKRINIFTYILIGLGVFTIISGGAYFIHSCFQVPDELLIIYDIGLGLLSLTYAISESVLNSLMISCVCLRYQIMIQSFMRITSGVDF